MDFSEYHNLNGKPNIILTEQKSNKRFNSFIYIIIIILLFVILYKFFRNKNLNNLENKKIGI